MMLALSALSPDLWFLVLFGLVPLFWAIKILGANRIKWGILGSLSVGFAHSAVVFYPLSTLNTWWWTVSSGFFWEYRGLVYFAVGLLFALFVSLFTFGFTFFIYSAWLRKNIYASIIILPIVWLFLEVIRVKIGFGLEWGIFGQPLGENLFFARSAVFGGIFTLSFLAVMINFCVFLLLESFFDRKMRETFGQKLKKLMDGKIIASIAVMLAIFVGLALNNNVVGGEFGETNRTKLNVAIISPSIKTSGAVSQDGINHIFDLIAEAVTEAPTGNPKFSNDPKSNIPSSLNLIIFPENTFPSLSIDEKTLQPLNYETRVSVKENFDRLLKISAEHPKTSFIIGLHTSKDDMRFNSAVVFEEGKIVSIYNKQNLLPFTEKSFSFLEAIHIDPLTSGRGNQMLKTKYGNFSPLICSEVLVSRNIPSFGSVLENPATRTGTQADTRALINLSNDNIFDSKRVAAYNKIIVRLRAIQTGQALIRSAKGGFSGIFDKTGREIPMQTVKNGGNDKNDGKSGNGDGNDANESRNEEVLFGVLSGSIDIP